MFVHDRYPAELILRHGVQGDAYVTLCAAGERVLGHHFSDRHSLGIEPLRHHFHYKVTISDNPYEDGLPEIPDHRNRADILGDHEPPHDIDGVTRHTADQSFAHDGTT